MTDSPTVLVADDDASIRIVIEKALRREGMAVRSVDSGTALWRLIENGQGDVVITDVLMPDENGLDLLPRILEQRPDLPVIVMSAQNTLTTAVRATEKGAFDYLAKPFDINELTALVKTSCKQTETRVDVDRAAESEGLPLIGRSRPMQELYRRMARVMQTDMTVLITGESGTGKELVARALHQMGPRSAAPFIAVNMAAIPRELIESELFGHEKGAFTGASSRSTGRFGEAQKGTLFLDEIGDMPFEAQTRLLRVLQEGEYTALGTARPVKSDVRIIAATNTNLMQAVRTRRFREDLFYRLNVVPLAVPPLRQRSDDISELAAYFLKKAEKEGLGQRQLSDDAIRRLASHSWPGNVRELENLIRRLVVLSPEPVITASTVEDALKEAGADADLNTTGVGLAKAIEAQLKRYFDAHSDDLPPPGLYDRIVSEVERPLLALTLKATRGNQLRAARVLGLNRNTLRKKLRLLGITAGKPDEKSGGKP